MKKTKMICLSIIVTSLVWGLYSDVDAATDPFGPQGKRFGIGAIAGEPSGLTLKGYLTSSIALDIIVSWSFVDDSLTLIGDLTYEFFPVPFNIPAVDIPLYLGVGGIIAFDKGGKNDGRTIVGARVPIGIALQFEKLPIELFAEVGPGIEVSPETKFDFTGGAGVRYYF